MQLNCIHKNGWNGKIDFIYIYIYYHIHTQESLFVTEPLGQGTVG